MLLWLILIVILVLDQAAKYLASINLLEGETIPVINGIFHITLVHNRGAAFGLFQAHSGVFVVLSIIVASLILYLNYRWVNKGTLVTCVLALIVGGAIGNLIDRIRLGYVVDFLDFRIWPVFNVADSAISIGTIVLIIYIIRKPCS
ncbi:MAG: signal peptidase II [Candidatus Omnitrophica bacterium]|nr:signal peptidase II [Candidatus Omnitrophota bacterium]